MHPALRVSFLSCFVAMRIWCGAPGNVNKKMPYDLRKSPKKGYWVVNRETGKKYSKRPIPLERAQRQRRAIYASENGYFLKSRRRRSPVHTL